MKSSFDLLLAIFFTSHLITIRYFAAILNKIVLSRNALVGILEAKRLKKQKRASRTTETMGNIKKESPKGITSPSTGNFLNGSPSSIGVNRSVSSSSMFERNKKHREKETKRKLRKEDIGLPHNFR